MAVLVAAIVSLSPAMAGFVGWTICYFYPPAICACIGFAAYAERLACRGMTVLAFTLVTIGALVTLLIYQPLAGFVLLPPFLSRLSGRDVRIRVPVVFLGALSLAYVLYATCLFPTFHRIDPQWASSERGNLSFSLQHLEILLFVWLPVLATGWVRLIADHSTVVWLSIPSIAAFCYGCYHHVFKESQKSFRELIILILFLVFSAPHVLLLTDIWAFRIFYPLYCLFFLVAASGVIDLLERINVRGTVILIAVLFGLTFLLVIEGIVIPARREYMLIKNSLRDAAKESDAISVILGTRNEVCPPLTFVKRFDAFGNLSCDTMGDVAIRAVAKDLWTDKTDAPTLLFTDHVRVRSTQGIAFADIWGLMSGNPTSVRGLGVASARVDTPCLGSLPSDGSWLYHPELGWIHPMVDAPWYFSPSLGRIAFWFDHGHLKAWIRTEYLDVISTAPLMFKRQSGEIGTPAIWNSQVILTWKNEHTDQ
jgi:hypothetical protein